MSFWQRIMGAAARLFGPPSRVNRDGEARRVDSAGFAAALVALGAKMAKADGVVTRSEIEAFKRVFQVEQGGLDKIGRLFDMARQTTLGYEGYAKIIARKFRAQPAALEDVIDGLFHIALADGVVTDDEMNFLVSVAEIFGFSKREFRRITQSHLGRPGDDPYVILGVDSDISDADLKRAYRRMASTNHPDRLIARGLPQELQKLANHKMAVINGAYAEIVQARANAAERQGYARLN